LGSRGSQWGRPGGKVREGAGGSEIQGCPGWEHNPQNSPKGCFAYFLKESIAILAGSGMQGAASSDFQQMRQEIGRFEWEGCC